MIIQLQQLGTRKELNPLVNIFAQPLKTSVGRYFIIFPDGVSHIIEDGEDDFPCDKHLGNVFENLDAVIKELSQNNSLDNNSTHGVHLNGP